MAWTRHRVIQVGCGLALAMAVPTAAAATRPQQAMAEQRPEISPEASLPKIFAALRRSLKDAASISDFALCPEPRKVKMKNGQPVRWTYMFSINARNAMGGYSGLQHFAAILYVDKPVEITSVSMAGDDAIAALTNQWIEKDMAKCEFLPKPKLEALLATIR